MGVIDQEVYDIVTPELQCDNCHCRINMKTTIIMTKQISLEEKLEVKYFRCKSCGKSYVVSIDNKESSQVSDRIKLELKRLNRDKALNKDTSSRQSKVIRLYEQSKLLHDSLKQKYIGVIDQILPQSY